MKNNSRIWLVGIVLFFAIFVFVYVNFAKNEQGDITQGDLAKIVADRMNLPGAKNASASKCIDEFKQRGVEPSGGWRAEQRATSDDLARVLAGAGRVSIPAGKDPVRFLKEKHGLFISKDINRKIVENTLEDPNGKRLLENASISGAAVPYPLKKAGGAVVQPPPANTPPPPVVPEKVDASTQ